MTTQISLSLPKFSRGFHLITSEIEKILLELPKTGILHIFIKHTSAGLTINENYDSTVRQDFETVFNQLIPEGETYYTHTAEGSDDMPAHIKSTLVGNSVSIPITNHTLNLGTWQGVYLCEFRNDANSRELVFTIIS